MQRRWLMGSAAVAALALLAWAFAPRPLPVELAEAAVGPFEQVVTEEARTRLVERYVVSAPLAGRLARLRLREGDEVAAGAEVAALLPVLSPMLDERTRLELGARRGAAEAGLAQSRTRVAAARIALERARTEFARSEQLARQGYLAPTRIEADRLAALSAEQELRAAEQGEQVARHELEQAGSALAVVRAAGPEGGAAAGPGGRPFVLRAPTAGRVLRLFQQSETVLAQGAPVLEIGDTARLEIVAELLTTDALQAVPGRRVRIEQWGAAAAGGAPAVLEGRVRRVEPAAFTKVSALGVEEQRVRVLIDLVSPRAQWAALGDGWRVVVNIVTVSEEQVLRVPSAAVFPLPAGAASTASGAASGAASNAASTAAGAAHAVFAVRDGRARLQPVQLAGRNGQLAWLRAGLAAGERVIVYPGATVVDGQRVAARQTRR